MAPTNDRILDYIKKEHIVPLANGDYIYGEEAIRASLAQQKLKNIVLLVLNKNKESRKVPKLKDILKLAIQRI